jgi:hypothetical protein
MEHVEHVSGRRGLYALRALLRSGSRAFAARAKVALNGLDGFEPALRSLLGFLHPRKFQAVGEAGIAALLELGRADAEARGLAGAETLMRHAAWMFLLGSWYAEDPQFPWAAEALADPSLTDPERRAHALFERADAHRERVLALIRAKRA